MLDILYRSATVIKQIKRIKIFPCVAGFKTACPADGSWVVHVLFGLTTKFYQLIQTSPHQDFH